MKVWYTLGINGVRVLSLKESLKTLSEKVVESEAGSGVATFTFPIKDRYAARKVIAKIDRWLSKQDWFQDNEIVTFCTHGLLSENGEEWVCEECSNGIDGCSCNTLESSKMISESVPITTVAVPYSTVFGPTQYTSLDSNANTTRVVTNPDGSISYMWG
jgi:hypothetical protein